MIDGFGDGRDAIFRRGAIERRMSAARSDEIIAVASPHDWLALAGVTLLALTTVGWLLLGSVPTRVGGRCIVRGSGGLHDLAVERAGRLAILRVSAGDVVAADAVVAQLESPEQTDQLELANRRLDDIKAQLAETLQLAAGRSRERQTRYLAQQGIMAQRLGSLQAELAGRERLARQGFGTWQAYRDLERDAQALDQEREALATARVDAEQDLDLAVVSLKAQLAAAKGEADARRAQYEDASEIRAPFAGRVVELRAYPGDVLAAGAPVLSLERLASRSARLLATAYVPADRAKSIQPGMTAEVIPARLAGQAATRLRGIVQAVAPYPTTPAGAQRSLQNLALVRTIAAAPVTTEVQIVLAGSPRNAEVGSLCSARITTARERPIQWALPAVLDRNR